MSLIPDAVMWPLMVFLLSLVVLLFLVTLVAHAVAIYRSWKPEASPRPVQTYDEAVLLGPVSAWVAEGEARAVRDWEAKHPTRPGPLPYGQHLVHFRQPGRSKAMLEHLEREGVDCVRCDWIETTAVDGPVREYIRGRPCGVCPATRDPDLPWPMLEAERR